MHRRPHDIYELQEASTTQEPVSSVTLPLCYPPYNLSYHSEL